MAQKLKKLKLPLSGDRLVDTLFRMLIDILENMIESIKVKKVLRYPNKNKEELRGLLTEGKIFLGKRKHRARKEPMVLTLIHEVLHATCPYSYERRIRQLENAIYQRFTDAQKRYLREYIPNYVVKEEPVVSPSIPQK